MRIIVIVSILLSAILIADCNKPMDPLPNPCEIEPCDTSEPKLMMGPHEIAWIKSITIDTASGANKDVLFTEHGIINNYSKSGGYGIVCFDKESNINWRWNKVDVSYFPSMKYHQAKGILIVQRYSNIAQIDASTGNTLLSINGEGYAGNNFGQLLGDYYYYTRATSDENFSCVVRSHIDDFQQWDTVYTITRSEVGGSRPNAQSYNLWVDPETGEEILVLQHRMAFPNRVDVVGYNITQDTLHWRYNDIEPNNSSSTSQILIVEDRAYFQGLNTLYCFDIPTGDILWQQRYLDPKRYFTGGKLTYIEEEELLITKEDGESVMAFDALTGYEKWDQDRNAGTNGNEGDYYKGVFYYTASGALHAVDISNGRMIWYEKSRLHQHSVLDGPVVIDKENGVLYASDRRYLIAVDLESGD